MKFGVEGLLLLGAMTGGFACGGEDCPDTSGRWNIAQHCDQTLTGMSFDIQQDDCSVEVGAPFDGFRGRVESDGTFTIGGTFGETVITCDGNAAEDQITILCQPDDCGVAFQR